MSLPGFGVPVYVGRMPASPSPGTRKRKGSRPRDPALLSTTRAVEAFRLGLPVAIRGKDGNALALAVETAPDGGVRALGKSPLLLLSHARARTLKIRLYTPEVVALPVAPGTPEDSLRAIADPTADLSAPLKGPFEAGREPLPQAFAASVKLAKLAGLLPATVVRRIARIPPNLAQAEVDGIWNYELQSARALKMVARARVPLMDAENAELVAFRAPDGGPEHYAIVIGAPPTDAPVLARLHSECFTGDLLGSLKCDCGDQLRGAIAAIARAGGGVLLYLAQEGRGIGLVNKLRAYRLQDQGFDTHEANERLGFEADERLYPVAARMFALLGFKAVRLMTNNPSKVKGLKAAGIKVAERVPHAFPANPHNARYLKSKEKAGHLF